MNDHTDQALKLLSKFYKNWKILNPKKIDPEKLYKKMVKELLEYLQISSQILDPGQPVTQFSVQMITKGYLTEKKFIEVNLNIKAI